MICSQAAALLNALQVGKRPDGAPAVSADERPLLDALIAKGLVARIGAGSFDAAALERLKGELAQMQAARPADGPMAAAPGRGEMDLREKILELAGEQAAVQGSLDVGGQRVSVTYTGRSLLGAIMPRLDRVSDMDLDAFEREMGALRQALSARAAAAQAILKVISPRLSKTDEIHLRSAAVGLSSRPEPADRVAAAFLEVEHALSASNAPLAKVPLLAECVCAAGLPSDRPAAEQSATRMLELVSKTDIQPVADADDALAVAGMLFPLSRESADAAMTRARALGQSITDATGVTFESMAPWVLAAVGGVADAPGAVDWLAGMRTEIINGGASTRDADLAAAILISSQTETWNELAFQFKAAKSYLSRLSTEAMVVPAAMLAALGIGVDEALDDLRMASSEVSLHKLSLGGMENLSLGVKLLSQTALLASGPAAAPPGAAHVAPLSSPPLGALGLPGLAAILPTALAAFAAFHEVTLHQAAVNDYAFHPVHTMYIYG